MKDSYLEVEFKVFRRIGAHPRHVDGDRKRLVVLGPTALFIKYRLTSSSGKKIEEIDKAHVICLMHSLISSKRDSDNLSYGFHRINEARERELTKKYSTNGNYHARIYSKVVFGFAKYQDNCPHGLSFKLNVQRKSNILVLSHLAVANDAPNHALAGGVTLDDRSLYVPLDCPKLSNRKLKLGHIVSKTATELSNHRRSFF